MTELYTLKESKKYPGLFVRKYKKKVFFDNLWHKDDTLLESRGHVFNKDGKLVINPFTKIFNYGENGTTIDDNQYVLWVEKINGFMACATYVEDVDDVVISTTGSLDSDYVDMASEMISDRFKEFIAEVYKQERIRMSYMFEIVHPNDPHIIEEQTGAYLLGCRTFEPLPYMSYEDVEFELDEIADRFGMLRPRWGYHPFWVIQERAKIEKHEGFVCYDMDNEIVLKLKGTYYLTAKAIARRKDILSLDKTRVDEEYYPLIEYLQKHSDTINNLTEQEKLNFIRNYLEGLR